MNRRELKNAYRISFAVALAIGVWLASSGLWIAVPLAVVWIAFCLGFLWPTRCGAYRTNGVECEATVKGWFVGCGSHDPNKWRDLRAVANPRNTVSPFHTAGQALRVPARDATQQPLLEGAPREVTIRSLRTAMALAFAICTTLVGLLVA